MGINEETPCPGLPTIRVDIIVPCAVGETGKSMLREWIIFALCLGAGGHIALAIVLHAPEAWPWPQAGLAGLLTGVALYGAVQAGRALWRMVRPNHARLAEDEQDGHGIFTP